MAKTKKVKLWCQGGEHHWMRESKRGKRPIHCPKHRPVVAEVVKTEGGEVELYCEAGKHNWMRESKRGRKPVNCPEHSHAVVAAKVKAKVADISTIDDEQADREMKIIAITASKKAHHCRCGISPKITDEELVQTPSCNGKNNPREACPVLKEVREAVYGRGDLFHRTCKTDVGYDPRLFKEEVEFAA